MSATAATTAADQHVRSHKGRRHSRNKTPDPFLELSGDALAFPTQPSPSARDENGTYRSDTLIADLVLTPINVISFILSLLVVERQARVWRHSQHAQAPETTFWSQFADTGPEPYQDSKGAAWHPRLSWRRRGIAKAQMESVFEMRRRVIVGLIVWTILGALVIVYVARRIYHWTSS